jgi:hypothetical protein
MFAFSHVIEPFGVPSDGPARSIKIKMRRPVGSTGAQALEAMADQLAPTQPSAKKASPERPQQSPPQDRAPPKARPKQAKLAAGSGVGAAADGEVVVPATLDEQDEQTLPADLQARPELGLGAGERSG